MVPPSDPDGRRLALCRTAPGRAALAAPGYGGAVEGAGQRPDQHGADVRRVAERLADVQRRIAAAAVRVGRSPTAVTMVAVSKGFGPDQVAAARRAGQVDFGESRAQELAGKAAVIGPGLRWHFVGRLQRNKVKRLVGLVSLIHSIDRLELAEAVAERARRSGRVQRVLVQVNAGEDPAKGGCPIDEGPRLVARVRALEGIACEGLTAIPPLESDPRPTFVRLRQLRDDLRARFPEVQHLSMGMTKDFEIAVEEGATIVRLGEAVFGPRPQAGPT